MRRIREENATGRMEAFLLGKPTELARFLWLVRFERTLIPSSYRDHEVFIRLEGFVVG